MNSNKSCKTEGRLFPTANFRWDTVSSLGFNSIIAPRVKKEVIYGLERTNCALEGQTLYTRREPWSRDKAHYTVSKWNFQHGIKQRASKRSVSGSNRCNKSSKNDTYMINKAPLLYIYIYIYIYATGKLWLIMWQLHLLNNIQNATYLWKWNLENWYSFKSLNFFFCCFCRFIIFKQEQKQNCPVNRYYRDKILMIFKDKTLEKQNKNATTRKQHKRKQHCEGSDPSASTGVDKDKVPGHKH